MFIYYHHLTFFGRVFPSGTHVTATDVPEVIYVDERYHHYAVRMKLKLVDRAIEISCDFTRLFDGHLSELYIRALNYAQTVINLSSFQMGMGAQIVLDRWSDQHGETEMHLFEPSAANVCSAFSSSGGLPEVFNLIFSEPPIIMALNDLILGLSMPNHALINCARSVEALRHLIAGPNADRKTQWRVMRESLNVDQAYITLITDMSTDPRHGNQTVIAGPIVAEVIKRSWTIMDRFFHFRKNGNQKLPLDRFPLLAG